MKWLNQMIGPLKFAVAFGLIYFLYSKGLFDLQAMKQVLSPWYLLIFAVLTSLSILITNLRLYFLIRLKGLSLGFWSLLPTQLIGLFFNHAIPGGVGGDLVKGYYLVKDFPEKKEDAALAVLMDRILGLYAMILLALFSMLMSFELVMSSEKLQWIAVSSLSLGLTMTVGLYLTLSERVRQSGWLFGLLKKLPFSQTLTRLYETLSAYSQFKVSLLGLVGLSLLTHLIIVLFIWIVAQGIGETQIPLLAFFFVIPLGLIVTSIPIAPAGIGVGQVAFMALFKVYTGESSIVGQTGITLFQLSIFLFSLSGAFFYLRRRPPKTLTQKLSQKSTEEASLGR